jgi:hypothetical protein
MALAGRSLEREMPASPHQLAVLVPRTKRQIADEVHTTTALRTERETVGRKRRYARVRSGSLPVDDLSLVQGHLAWGRPLS